MLPNDFMGPAHNKRGPRRCATCQLVVEKPRYCVRCGTALCEAHAHVRGTGDYCDGCLELRPKLAL